jgi:hypothetical protein
MTKQLTMWPSGASGPETDSDDAPTQRIEAEKKPDSDSASVADTVVEAVEAVEAVADTGPKKRKLEKEPKRPKKVAKTEKQIEKDLDTKLDLVIDTLNALLAVLKKN